MGRGEQGEEIWYNKVGVGDRAFEVNSASHRTKRRVGIPGVMTVSEGY